MKVLITGITGFIGQNLSIALLNESYEVHALVRKNSDISVIHKNINVHIYNNSALELIELFNNEKFDGVIHLASLFLAKHSSNDIHNLVSSNIEFGTQLLEASSIANVTWFINTGTFWQNYENADYNPVNLYAATKEAFQSIARYYTETSNLVFTTIKLNDTFGQNDTRGKVFTLWTKILNTGEQLEMSAGEQIIDISYIDDVVTAYIKLIELLSKDPNGYRNKEYVVSNTDKMSLKNLARLFEEVTQEKLKIKWGARAYREREVMIPYSQGKCVPGWKQSYTLKQAIENTVKDIK